MAKATVHNVDFTNVKDGGVFNTKRIEAGDYLAKIIKVEDHVSKSEKSKGTPQYLFTIRLVNLPSSTFPYYCQLTENQLWKLRNLLIAAGKTVPKRRAKVDPNTIVGKVIGVLIEDDEYEGKERSTIAGVFPAADLGDSVSAPDEDDEDEDEEDAPLEEEEIPDTSDDDDEADEDEADEDDEDEADPLADLTRAQLKAEIIKLQSDFQARKSQSDDDLRDVLRGLQNAADEDDEEEDDEPTPPPAKAKKTKAAAEKKAPAKRKAKPKAEDIDDEELDELDIDNL